MVWQSSFFSYRLDMVSKLTLSLAKKIKKRFVIIQISSVNSSMNKQTGNSFKTNLATSL